MYRAVIEDLSSIWKSHRPRLGGEPSLVCLQGSAEGAADGIVNREIPCLYLRFSLPVDSFNVQLLDLDVGIAIKVQKEAHVKRQGQQRSLAPDVVVAKLDGVAHVIMRRVVQDGRQAFRLARLGLHLQGRTFAVVSDEEIEFKP